LRLNVTCMLSSTRPRFDVANSSVLKYIFGGGASLSDLAASGPK
jgi:hypothetical protein